MRAYIPLSLWERRADGIKGEGILLKNAAAV